MKETFGLPANLTIHPSVTHAFHVFEGVDEMMMQNLPAPKLTMPGELSRYGGQCSGMWISPDIARLVLRGIPSQDRGRGHGLMGAGDSEQQGDTEPELEVWDVLGLAGEWHLPVVGQAPRPAECSKQ